MLDPRLVKEKFNEVVKQQLARRYVNFDNDTFNYLIANLNKKQQDLEKLKAKRNAISKKIGQLVAQKSPVDADLRAEVLDIKEKLALIESEYNWMNKQFAGYHEQIPNFLDDDVPTGKDEQDNKLVRQAGEKPQLAAPVLSHYELAEKLAILDVVRGVKVSKSRFSLLKGAGAQLERAVAQFMIDRQSGENGYLECSVPLLVNHHSMFGSGQLPKFLSDMYYTGDLFLIPTAEVPLTALFRDEILAEQDLPMKMVALTPCFRREAGAYGKDTKGLIRQHQFYKVELVWLTTPEASKAAHLQLVSDATMILDELELPYRVMLLCGGDTGFSASKCYDLEVYLPFEKRYREISSCSNCTDFQARRLNIRYRPKGGGSPRYIHTLNGSGLAVGRALVAILENYQTPDGRVKIPTKLRSYFGGREFL